MARLCDPTDENHHFYKKQRKTITTIIRKTKKRQFEKLGSNPTAKTKYKTLKTHKNDDVRFQDYPELDSLNKHFATIGSRLSLMLPMKNLTFNMPATENSMVIFSTDELEIGKVIAF